MSIKELYLDAEEITDVVSVPVPEWVNVGTVYLVPMTGDDRDAYDQIKADKMYPIDDQEEPDWRGLRALVVSMHMADKNGTKCKFSDMERRQLGSKSAKVLDRIYRKCCEISGLTSSAVEEAEKNLPEGQNESSG